MLHQKVYELLQLQFESVKLNIENLIAEQITEEMLLLEQIESTLSLLEDKGQ